VAEPALKEEKQNERFFPRKEVEKDQEKELTTALVLSPEVKNYYKEVEGADLDPELLKAAPSDFFELLGVSENATSKEVKAAYRQLQKVSHPDIAGEAATPFAVILNMAYNTLFDDDKRELYAAQAMALKQMMGGSFTGRPLSKWAGPDHEKRAVFIDESECIGCTNCAAYAPKTFENTDYGRARCSTQWGDSQQTIQLAIETCPVDCIYWVRRDQLAVLEFSMKSCDIEDISVIALRRSGNMGSAPARMNPWLQAERLLKMRKDGRTAPAQDRSFQGHDEGLAGAIAAAWLELPADVRRKGWPAWSPAA
jgi:ferredoxin